QRLVEAKTIDSEVAAAFEGTNSPGSLKQASEKYNKLFAAAAENEKDTKHELLRKVLVAENSPIANVSIDYQRLYDVPTAQKMRALKRKVDELDATHPGAP